MTNNAEERCDIVIPVWNHEEMTQECIESIRKNTTAPYRIIIIDNASEEPTRDYLDSLVEESQGDIILVRNTENQGFTRAVNQGMRLSDAPYVCILNNDTLVTAGWLAEIMRVFRENADIGIVNPSSNTFCNSYSRMLKALSGEYQELLSGRAFAMVVKRDVIAKIGYLDDIYGMGYYDDTDYSKRAQGSGYRIVRAKASYVFHGESQSFLKFGKKSDIFTENEKKFIAKWGRQLRVAYVVPDLKDGPEIKKVSSNIENIVKSGHYAWVFTKRRVISKLKLADHEGIRFFRCPAIFFTPIVFYKILKRKRKKKLCPILTNSIFLLKVFKISKGILGTDVFPDSDPSSLKERIRSISFAGND